MKEIKVLFTGIGRRIELISAFRQAALFLNIDLKIVGADMTGTAPALVFCDYSKRVCSMKDSDYIPELQKICAEEHIDLLIPTIDTDLLLLSQNAACFGSTKVLISTPDKIAICRDKNNTAKFFETCGCCAPKTFNNWKEYKGGYPCFIKPKDGSSSINAFKVNTIDELRLYAELIKDYVIQQYIDGIEYTVDILCDFDSNPIYITPRVRLQVRSGEVLKTQISMDKQIINECKQIIDKFRPVGPITIQLIRQRETGIDYFIEINPRFGGGAPLSMNAGARSAEAILKLIQGEKLIKNDEICDGAIYSRFDNSVCIHNGIPQTVRGVIFDLDDTLYNEKDYIKSGFSAIQEWLCRKDTATRLWKHFENKLPAIDAYLSEIGLSEQKENCLKVYREHIPTIKLLDGVVELLADLRSKHIRIGIITDGRPNGQRNKIAALRLDEMVDDIIITDELGGEQFRKPCDIAFRIMQRRWKIPFEQIMYVGDNAIKDFQAPQQLGMQVCLINNGNGLYSTDDNGIKISQLQIGNYLE
ncbi:MAG: ATP-grasp domain-containing protein [Clostridiales bacterium]|nr:ATP-grasp domain-containing protein [Clostridiales bacterium]